MRGNRTSYKAEVEERCAAAAVHKSIQARHFSEKFNTSIIANNRGESLELGRFSHLPTPGHQLWENGEELLLFFFRLSFRKFHKLGIKEKVNFLKGWFVLPLQDFSSSGNSDILNRGVLFS